MKHKKRTVALSRSLETALDLPIGVLTEAPRMELSGNRHAVVEGCESILEYGESCIRLRTAAGIVRITGCALQMHCRTPEHAVITGRFLSLEFL